MIIQRENRVRAPASVGRTELDAALPRWYLLVAAIDLGRKLRKTALR